MQVAMHLSECAAAALAGFCEAHSVGFDGCCIQMQTSVPCHTLIPCHKHPSAPPTTIAYLEAPLGPKWLLAMSDMQSACAEADTNVK